METLHVTEPVRDEPKDLRAPRVLIVEDDKEIREAIREVFLMRGFCVNTAEDGLVAAGYAFAESYDVVVSDIRMPEMGGLDLLRALEKAPHPPKVILITAYPDWKVAIEGLKTGAWRVMYKPFNLVKLAMAVEEAAAGYSPGGNTFVD
jgi:DNA-binding response OmpR family regulator